MMDDDSIHIYTGRGTTTPTSSQAHQAERAMRSCAALIERVRYTERIAHPIDIAYDEWNVWYRTRGPEERVGGSRGAATTSRTR